MRRKAHTLAEVLVALAVVGVLGAVVVPMANKFKPDINKIKFLKNYDAIVQVNNHLIYDEDLYPPTADDEFSHRDNPLYNTRLVTYDGVNIGDHDNKYCDLLSLFLAGSVSEACQGAEYPDNRPDGAPHFTIKDGTEYWVYTQRGHNNNIANYRSDIYIDIDRNGANCLEDTEVCPIPDRFHIIVEANGETLPAGRFSTHYLNTRTNYRLNRDININNLNFTPPNIQEFVLEPANN